MPHLPNREASTQIIPVYMSYSFRREVYVGVGAGLRCCREGMESMLFLVGVVSNLKDLTSQSIPIVSALVLAILVACLFQGTTRERVDLSFVLPWACSQSWLLATARRRPSLELSFHMYIIA